MAQPLPPSRSSSYIGTSRSTSLQPAFDPPSAHDTHEGHWHKLLHKFDSHKHAIFLATVTLHELGNVPQLEGEFACQWRFHGQRPKGKDVPGGILELGPKPSLPNLKLSQPASTFHPSTSSLSLRSTSGPARAPLPTISPGGVQSTRLSSGSGANLGGPERKPSDPTPLRQSIGPYDVVSPVMESTKIMAEPEEEPDLMSGAQTNSGESSGESFDVPNGGVYPSVTLQSSSSMRKKSSGPSRTDSLVSSNSASSDNLAFLFPKPRQVLASASSSTSNLDSSGFLHALSARQRTTSGPGQHTSSVSTLAAPSKSEHSQRSSHHRKGTTPGRPLKTHTCTWDYEIQHMIRIPLGKPIMPTFVGRSSPQKLRQPAPQLGAGPAGDSGLTLTIEQLPTPTATSSARAKGANTDSVSSIAQAVHHAHKHGGNPSEASGKGNQFQTEKTVFGTVNIDLAPFAGRGKTTRRFLLRSSRTNAVVRVTVDMKWVGGEDNWAAPPLKEGHHVTGIEDITGLDLQDTLRSDLDLAKTPSGSSGSSQQSQFTPSNQSMAPSMDLTHSATSLVRVPPPIAYKSYEHHLLKPEAAARRPAHSVTTPEHSKLVTPRPLTSHHSPISFGFNFYHHHHRHHFHHMRGDRYPFGGDAHELSPEAVIEAVFNPYPSHEEGPFTYVPKKEANTGNLQSEQATLPNEEEALQEPDGPGGRSKLGWGFKARKEEKKRVKMERLASGMSIATANAG